MDNHTVLRVAYHDGPPQISFGGNTWRRGVPEAITRAAWDAMRARADFAEFDFRPEPVASAAPVSQPED